MIEAGQFSKDDAQVLAMLGADIPVILVANKLDVFASNSDSLHDRDFRLLEFLKEMATRFEFAEIVPMTAKHPDDVARLMGTIESYLPERPALYPADTLTDRSERFLAAEILREKVFRHTGAELPYASSVVIEQFSMDGKMRRIAATILVDRDSHKPMVIGEKGEKLKRISTEARLDMEKLFAGKVFLETWVKVKRGWADDQVALREQGLE